MGESPLMDHEAARAFRFRGIKRAVVSSLGSKVITVGVQLIAIPVAFDALGSTRFGIFLMITSVLGWMSLGRLGSTAWLTRGIAKAAAEHDRQLEARFFSTAFFLLVGVNLAICSLVIAVLNFAPATSLFGSQYADSAAEIVIAASILAVLTSVQTVGSCFEAARAGHQKQYLTTLWYIGGSVVSIVAILLVARYWPTIPAIILAVTAPLAVASLCNGGVLIAHDRPDLRPSRARVDRQVAASLFRQGPAFLLIQAAGIVKVHFLLVIVGWVRGPEEAAQFGVIIRLFLIAAGLVTMITQPLWPAIVDSLTRGDRKWIRQSYVRAIILVVAYSAAVGTVLALGGNFIVTIWLGTDLGIPMALQWAMGLSFVFWMWAQLHESVLIGIGQIWPAATILAVEVVLVAGLGFALTGKFGATGMGVAMVVGSIAVTFWVMPWLVLRTFGQLSPVAQPAPQPGG